MASEDEEFEFRARAEKEAAMRKPGGSAMQGIMRDLPNVMFGNPAKQFAKAATNPENVANAAPGVLGMAGAISPVPMGATMGTAAGQGMRDLALGALKQPVPSGLQHGLELGTSALGDVAAIPFVKGRIFGKAIGEAEKAAGVTTRAPLKAVTPGSVGKTLNELETAIDAGKIRTPQAAKDAKAIISQVYKNPKIYEQTGEISVQAQRVSSKVQNLINEMIPGRVEPAQQMAQAMKVPNFIKKTYGSLPWPMRRSAEAYLGWEGIKKLLGQ